MSCFVITFVAIMLFSVLMFWFNVNFENTFGVCSVITFITTIFDSIMLRILVRFQQLFLSYFIPKCFDSLCTLSACLSLNLKWHESHLSNFFIIWLFVDSTRAFDVDLLSQSSQPNTSPSCLIWTCFVILQLWFALYSHKSQWYHKLLWVLWIWESNMAVWIPS